MTAADDSFVMVNELLEAVVKLRTQASHAGCLVRFAERPEVYWPPCTVPRTRPARGRRYRPGPTVEIHLVRVGLALPGSFVGARPSARAREQNSRRSKTARTIGQSRTGDAESAPPARTTRATARGCRALREERICTDAHSDLRRSLGNPAGQPLQSSHFRAFVAPCWFGRGVNSSSSDRLASTRADQRGATLEQAPGARARRDGEEIASGDDRSEEARKVRQLDERRA